jgi:hypothetical protein
VSLPEVRARYYRLAFTTPQPEGLPSEPGGIDLSVFGGAANLPKSATAYEIAELVLHPGARVNRFEDKAAFSTATGLAALATPAVAAARTISKDDVIDLAAKMGADGTLDWTPPPGRWTVLRFGYSPLGISNHPASPEGTGLEADKLSRSAVRAYFDAYFDQYKDAAGGLMGNKGLGDVITDSWEADAEIWLDLGSVKNLAELTVNGKSLGILWKPPFRAIVTGVLKPGANAVEAKVTNLWVNRLIGDRQPNAPQDTFTAMRFYRADSPLLPSGLLGPVTVLRRAAFNR